MRLILACFGLLILVVLTVRKRRQRQLVKENKIRATLDLRPLTTAEFAIKPEEKSAEYRGKINQHM